MDDTARLKENKGASSSSGKPVVRPRSKNEWPEAFVCPISNSLMADPVILPTGQSYERMCIQLWFQRGYRHCFKSGMAIGRPVLTPNLQLRSAIVVWCDQHRVLRPRVPSLELARDLLERSLSRAAASACDDSFNSPSSTTWFADDLDDDDDDAPQLQPGGVRVFTDDDSGRSEFFDNSSSGNMWWSVSSSGIQSGIQSGSWKSGNRAKAVELTEEEGQGWSQERYQAGPASRRGNWSRQSPASTTAEYDLSPPRQFLASRKTATDDALLSSSRDRSHQRQQSSELVVLESSCKEEGSGIQGFREGSGIRGSREYYAARAHHHPPSSQGQDNQSRGFPMWNPSRLPSHVESADQWVLPPQSHQYSANVTAECVSSSGASQASEETGRSDRPRLESSGCSSGANSMEYWHGSSTTMKGSRYVRSATSGSLTDEIQTAAEEEESWTRGIPLPLATTPTSYHRLDDPGLEQAPVGLEAEILHKLRHKKHAEQEKGVAEIRSLTRTSEDYRLTLCTSAILRALIPLLQSKHATLQSDATAALTNLSLPQENKVKVAGAGAIPYVIEVLRSKTEDAQVHAAGALFSLALNDDNKAAIGVLQAIPPLLHLLKSRPLEAQRDAAMALYHLSFLKTNRGKLLQAGAVALLMDLAGGESSAMASRVLLILTNLASSPEGRSAICDANGITELVQILARRSLAPPSDQVDNEVAAAKGVDDWASVREHAAAALLQLSRHTYRFKTQALRADAMKPLTMLAEYGTKRAKKKAAALLQILKDKPSEDDGDEEDHYAHAFRFERRDE